MKNKGIFSIVFILVFLLSFSLVHAEKQQDDILQARYDSTVWNSGESYTVGDLVIFDSQLYEVKKDTLASNDNPPPIAIDNYKVVKEKVKKSDYKEKKFKDKTLYTGDVSVKGNYLKGTETFVADRQLVGLADYYPENFTVSIYTGNDDVVYSIYSYHNETEPSNLNTDRAFIRTNGTFLFNVESQDGFLNYQTNGFSTQIASIPDQDLNYNQQISLFIGDYFTGYTEDEVFFDLTGLGYVSGNCDTLFNLNCKLDKDGDTIVTDELSVSHSTFASSDMVEFTAGTTSANNILMSFATNDGSNFESDSFFVDVNAPSTPAVTTATASAIGETTATMGGTITDTGGGSVDYGFEWRVVGAGSWTDVPKGTSSGTLSYTHDLTGLTATTDYEYRAYVDDGSTYYGTTKTFTTTAGGSSGGSGELNDAIYYYSFDDSDLTGSNPNDLSGNGFDGVNNGATTGVSAIINEAFSFDASGEYITTTQTIVGSDDTFTWVGKVYVDDASDSNQNVFFGTPTSGTGEVLFGRYNSDTFTVGIGKDGSNYEYKRSGTITSNTWYDIIVQFELVSGVAEVTFWLDNVEQTTSLSPGTVTKIPTPATIYTGSRETTTFPFNGDVDETGLYAGTLSSTARAEFSSMTSNPYDVVVPPPTQDASINNFALDDGESITIDLNDYFSDFTSYTITYDDPDSAGQIVLTGTQSDTSSTFTASTNGLTNELTITGIDEQSILPIEISVCNADGCISQTPTLTITEPLVPPVQISSLVGFTVVVPDSQVRDIDDWFTGFTSYTVQFTNPDDSQPVSLSGTDTHTNSKFTIATNGLTNEITVTGIDDITDLAFTVQVLNADGSLQDSSTITVSTTPLVPPTQEVDIPAYDINVGTMTQLYVDAYFSGYTSYTVSFTNPDDAQLVELTGSATHENSKFGVELTGDGIVIAGISEFTAIPYTISVCNTDGCISDSSTLGVSIVPTDVDEFLNGFGETGSPIMRLIIGLFIILALVVGGWYYTKTVFIGVFAGIIGLIITVAVGLISIWLVLLMILLSLIPLIYIWVFGGRNNG